MGTRHYYAWNGTQLEPINGQGGPGTHKTLNLDRDPNRKEWLDKNQGRLIIYNWETNRWSSCNWPKEWQPYAAQVTGTSKVESTPTEPIQYNTVQLGDLDINPDLLEPLKTNTPWDPFCSSDEGFLPGTNIMVVGAPGTGKTTLFMELLSNLNKGGKKVLFISAEMNRLDMVRYSKRFPNWSKVPILFLMEWENPKEAVEKIMEEGWDLVLIDSYTEMNDSVKETQGWSRGKTEKWFLEFMNRHNLGENQHNKHTVFLTILQLNKGGQFVGSLKLKHMTSAMLHIEWEGKENANSRYLYFSKNRLGNVGHRLFFEIGNQGLKWDQERYQREKGIGDLLKRETENIQHQKEEWDRIFSMAQQGVD